MTKATTTLTRAEWYGDYPERVRSMERVLS